MGTYLFACVLHHITGLWRCQCLSLANFSQGQQLSVKSGQTVAGRFLSSWEDLGTRALPLLDYPISPERDFRLEDGKVYRCQYFERARLELHGERVVLGRVGAEVYAGVKSET